jgi:hypothetical protein
MSQKQLTKADFEITTPDFLFHPNMDKNGNCVFEEVDRKKLLKNSYVEGEVWDGITITQKVYDFVVPFFYYFGSFFGLLLVFPLALEVEFWRRFFRDSWLGKIRREKTRPIFRKRIKNCYQAFLSGQVKAQIVEKKEQDYKKQQIEKYLDFLMWDSFDRK